MVTSDSDIQGNFLRRSTRLQVCSNSLDFRGLVVSFCIWIVFQDKVCHGSTEDQFLSVLVRLRLFYNCESLTNHQIRTNDNLLDFSLAPEFRRFDVEGRNGTREREYLNRTSIRLFTELLDELGSAFSPQQQDIVNHTEALL